MVGVVVVVIRVGRYPDVHIVIPSFSHTGIYSITGIAHEWVLKTQEKPIALYFLNASKLAQTDSKFP